jgi:Gluconate 2-dehydrogenase subunit 3
MIDMRGMAVKGFKHLQDISIVMLTRAISKEYIRREGQRGNTKFRWFTAEEAAVAEALTRIVIPSDEESPGLEDVSVLDPPAIVALDTLVSKSTHRQEVYSRGLLSFDVWAQQRHECKFAGLPLADQVNLFKAAEGVYENWARHGSAMNKAWRRLQAITKAKNGSFFASQLYPQIRQDCLQVFYTSRVSWVWLEYDGPPMDKGYPNLAARE